MRFCTTCGRNFETSIDICPHDGTPLFGMAGEEEKAAQDELVAEVASVLAGDERATFSVEPSSEEIPVDPGLPYDDVAAQEEEDLFGDSLVEPSDDVEPAVGLDDDSDPFGIAVEAGESAGNEPSEDLFADDSFGEDGEPSEAEEDFFSESAGLDEDDLFGEPSESSGVAQDDSDVSQQIAASIDGLLDEIDEDKGEKPLSMSSSLAADESVSVADPYEDDYVAKKGSKMPLLIILVLVLSSAAGIYFFMNGSLTNGVEPDANTPAVVAPKAPVQPEEEAVVEEAAPVEEAPAVEEEQAAVVEEPAAVVEKPAVEPVQEKPAPKPVVEKEKPPVSKPSKPAASKPAEEPVKEAKPAAKEPTAKEPTAEELLEEELKRMAP